MIRRESWLLPALAAFSLILSSTGWLRAQEEEYPTGPDRAAN